MILGAACEDVAQTLTEVPRSAYTAEVKSSQLRQGGGICQAPAAEMSSSLHFEPRPSL